MVTLSRILSVCLSKRLLKTTALLVAIPNWLLSIPVQSSPSMTLNINNPPQIPQVISVTVIEPGKEPTLLTNTTIVRGQVTLIPHIVTTQNIRMVNYYVDDSIFAAYSSFSPPWDFKWDTQPLKPHKQHSILLEVIDDSSPPQVGIRSYLVYVDTCNVVCQIRQRPLFLVGSSAASILLISIIAFAWLQSKHASRTFSLPQKSFFERFELPQHTTQSTSNIIVKRPQELPPKVAYLFHVGSEQNCRLGKLTVLGNKIDDQIVLANNSNAPIRATVVWANDNFCLTVPEGYPPVWINGKPVRKANLNTHDKIKIENEIFIFRQLS
jgi:hypothetical protein